MVERIGSPAHRYRTRFVFLNPVVLLPQVIMLIGKFQVGHGDWAKGLEAGDLIRFEAKIHRLKKRVRVFDKDGLPKKVIRYEYILRKAHKTEILRRIGDSPVPSDRDSSVVRRLLTGMDAINTQEIKDEN